MNVQYKRVLAIILVVVQLALIIPSIQTNALLNSQFNLDKTSSIGYTIMSLKYSNPSVETSFSGLADRALTLKNGKYSYSAAIQILTETKAVVSKVTKSDYEAYKEKFNNNVSNNGSMAYQFTYESFIMRNVLYTMLKEKASYTEFLSAIQIIYDTAVIQSQKGAFRSDALNVLVDVRILASYSTDKKISDMLFYVSNFTSGMSGRYDGKTSISSINVSKKYQDYLNEQYDKSHGDGNKIEHNFGNESDYETGDYGTIQTPSYKDDVLPDIDGFPNNNTVMDDSFSSDLNDLYGGNSTGKYVLYYTLNKSDKNPEYHKTKITTKQFVTYDNILEALKTASRNSSLLYVEDSDAVLLVYDGLCSVLENDNALYDEKNIGTLFANLNDFGLYIGLEENTSTPSV